MSSVVSANSAFNSTSNAIVMPSIPLNNCYLWKLCRTANGTVARVAIFGPANIFYAYTLALASLDWIQPVLAYTPSCSPRMQLPKLASCYSCRLRYITQLCACPLYACSYGTTIRAYFLSNFLHSNIRKYTSIPFKPPMHAVHPVNPQ